MLQWVQGVFPFQGIGGLHCAKAQVQQLSFPILLVSEIDNLCLFHSPTYLSGAPYIYIGAVNPVFSRNGAGTTANLGNFLKRSTILKMGKQRGLREQSKYGISLVINQTGDWRCFRKGYVNRKEMLLNITSCCCYYVLHLYPTFSLQAAQGGVHGSQSQEPCKVG